MPLAHSTTRRDLMDLWKTSHPTPPSLTVPGRRSAKLQKHRPGSHNPSASAAPQPLPASPRPASYASPGGRTRTQLQARTQMHTAPSQHPRALPQQHSPASHGGGGHPQPIKLYGAFPGFPGPKDAKDASGKSERHLPRQKHRRDHHAKREKGRSETPQERFVRLSQETSPKGKAVRPASTSTYLPYRPPSSLPAGGGGGAPALARNAVSERDLSGLVDRPRPHQQQVQVQEGLRTTHVAEVEATDLKELKWRERNQREIVPRQGREYSFFAYDAGRYLPWQQQSGRASGPSLHVDRRSGSAYELDGVEIASSLRGDGNSARRDSRAGVDSVGNLGWPSPLQVETGCQDYMSALRVRCRRQVLWYDYVLRQRAFATGEDAGELAMRSASVVNVGRVGRRLSSGGEARREGSPLRREVGW